jgi:hypothetical protein
VPIGALQSLDRLSRNGVNQKFLILIKGHNLLQKTLWTYLKNLKYNKVWMGKEEPLIIFLLKDFGELSNMKGTDIYVK